MVGFVQLNLRQSNYILPQSFLRKYFSYCREFEPTLSVEIIEVIKNYYTQLRRRVAAINGVQFTQRAIGTLIRLTEAHAKLHLQKQCSV